MSISFRKPGTVQMMLLSGVTAAIAAGAMSPAHAGVQHYCERPLDARYQCTGDQTSRGSKYVDVQSNHTACAIVAPNPPSATYPGPQNATTIACTDGAGTAGGYHSVFDYVPYGGGVFNKNTQTTDDISEAHMSY